MITINITPQMKGKFFTNRNHVISNVLDDMEDDIDKKGMDRLRNRFKKAPAGVLKNPTGYYHSRLDSNRHGLMSGGKGFSVEFHDSGVVYGPWLEGTSSRNQTTRFKGYSVFRKTRDWLESRVVPQLLSKYSKKIERELS
jgi:hypothetical protein